MAHLVNFLQFFDFSKLNFLFHDLSKSPPSMMHRFGPNQALEMMMTDRVSEHLGFKGLFKHTLMSFYSKALFLSSQSLFLITHFLRMLLNIPS